MLLHGTLGGYASNKCEALGSGKQLILHGNPSAIARDFLTAYGSPSTSFLPNVHFQCFQLLHGTLGGDFDIFADVHYAIDKMRIFGLRKISEAGC